MPSKSLPWMQQTLGRLRGLEPDPHPLMDPPAEGESPDAAFVISLALMIAESLLANGADGEETIAGMLVTAESYGLMWCEPDVTLWVVSLSGRMAEDTEPTVEQRIVRRRTTDFTALGATQQLIQEINEGRVSATEARERAFALSPAPADPSDGSRAARWLDHAVHGGVVAASGSLVAGGDHHVVIPSFLAATLAARMTSFLAAHGVPAFYRFALAAVPAAIAALVMEPYGDALDSRAIIVGGILALLPALTVISAVQDALTGHYLTAYARLMDATLVFLALVAGIGASLTVAARFGHALPLFSQTAPLDYLSWRLLGVAVFTAAIASRMNVPPRKWPLVMALGVGGLIAFIGLRDLELSRLLCTGCVAAAIGGIGQVLARRHGVSALPWVIPATTPLLPGSMLYRALSEMAVRDVEAGTSHLVQAVAMWVTLAAGVSFSSEAATLLRRLRDRGGRAAPATGREAA
ncbi:threonine/serine exporter family protein [Streptomyces sp. NPDC001941]|uniref:threonine/serine ThrE exporter family protein n=1 Tax=Streptomyces sp. NPDC001941 TaxID=3154659 RepID=UPI0033328ADB